MHQSNLHYEYYTSIAIQKHVFYNLFIKNTYFVIDFDSTFVKVETLEELAKIALENNPEKEKIIKEIADITRLGMEGKIDFPTALSKRLSLFKPHKNHITKLINYLKKQISNSVKSNKKFFKNNSKNVYIISGGFKEYILPVVKDFDINSNNILANTFIFDGNGNVIGYDKENPLANHGGKTKALKNLKLYGEIIVIGDGYTDYEIKKNKAATKFYAFVENVHRLSVAEKADKILANFNELLYKQSN